MSSGAGVQSVAMMPFSSLTNLNSACLRPKKNHKLSLVVLKFTVYFIQSSVISCGVISDHLKLTLLPLYESNHCNNIGLSLGESPQFLISTLKVYSELGCNKTVLKSDS